MKDAEIIEAYRSALARHGRATARVNAQARDDKLTIEIDHDLWLRRAPVRWRRPRGIRFWIHRDAFNAADCDRAALLLRESTSAVPGDSLASWEATVLPALRRAMAEHPELHGARVEMGDEHEPRFEVKLGQGLDRNQDHPSRSARRRHRVGSCGVSDLASPGWYLCTFYVGPTVQIFECRPTDVAATDACREPAGMGGSP